MSVSSSTLSPRQLFEDTLRPAELLLRVYRLLDCENLQSGGEMVTALRSVVSANADEDLLLIHNEIFMGLVRERAQMPSSALKRMALRNLLRQAVVVSCTALETYLPALLQANLPSVIHTKGRNFLPRNKDLENYFKNLTFSLDETLRITGTEDAPLYIANKLIGYTHFSYLSGSKGVQTVGLLLSLEDPWALIACKLERDADQLQKTLKDTTDRRNDIVHRADRPKANPTGESQDISEVWATQALDSIRHVCLALDELVSDRMMQLQTEAASSEI